MSAERACSDCGAGITRQSRTGRCFSCAKAALRADTAERDRRAARLAELRKDPAFNAARRAGIARHCATLSPAERERRREHGKRIAREVLSRPEHRAAVNAPDVRRRASAKRTATMLAWCPPELRARHRWNMKSKRMSSAESRSAIEAEIAAKREAARRAGGPRLTFEEQMARVMAGAQLVAKVQVRRPDPTMTLGGIASAAL